MERAQKQWEKAEKDLVQALHQDTQNQKETAETLAVLERLKKMVQQIVT